MSSLTSTNVYLRNMKNLFNKVKNEITEKAERKEPTNDIFVNVECARKEWEYAKNIFENVSDPDLIDYAIYNVEAAEKKYTYLIKQIKSMTV